MILKIRVKSDQKVTKKRVKKEVKKKGQKRDPRRNFDVVTPLSKTQKTRFFRCAKPRDWSDSSVFKNTHKMSIKGYNTVF